MCWERTNRLAWSAMAVAWFGLVSLGWATDVFAQVEATETSLPRDIIFRAVTSHGGRHFWAVGDAGAIYHSPDGRRTWQRQRSGVDCPLHDVDFIDERVGFAVGGYIWPLTCRSTGVVLRTVDGGATWNRIEAPLLPLLRTVHFVDLRNGWVAGSASPMFPSGVFHTDDSGTKWRPVPGGVQSGWHAGWFVSPTGGWLVGPGGVTAQVSRVGLRRIGELPAEVREELSQPSPLPALAPANILVLASDLGVIPWELVADWSVSRGYRVAVEVVGQRAEEFSRTFEALAQDRLIEAASRCRALTGHPDDTNGGRGTHAENGPQHDGTPLFPGAALQLPAARMKPPVEEVARALGNWRPQVVVLAAGISPGDQGVAELLEHAAISASQRMAGTNSGDDLETWQPERAFSVAIPERADYLVPVSRPDARLGGAAVDFAARSRWLTQSEFSPPPASIGLRRVKLGTAPGGADPLAGMPRQQAGRRHHADRNLQANSALGDMARRANRSRSIARAIAQRQTAGTGNVAPMQFETLISGLDSEGAGEVLFQLGNELAASGHDSSATNAWHTLVKRHPSHPLTDAGLIELMIRFASGEHAWQEHRRQQTEQEATQRPEATRRGEQEGAPRNRALPASAAIRVGPHAADRIPSKPAHTGENQNYPSPIENGNARSGEVAIGGLHPEKGPFESNAALAASLFEELQSKRPPLAAFPPIRAVAAVSLDRLGRPQEAERLWKSMAFPAWSSTWRSRAVAEQWRINHRGVCPLQQAECRRARSIPYLDGKHDDAWKTAHRLVIGRRGSYAMLMHDDQYLYIGWEVRKSDDVVYPPATHPRPRDADLSANDRVEWAFDIDRDYTTFYQFAVDSRGFPAEACNRDTTWNPRWFIARAEDDVAWRIEAAIPWQELTPRPPQRNETWAFKLRRIIPGVGDETWIDEQLPPSQQGQTGWINFVEAGNDGD